MTRATADVMASTTRSTASSSSDAFSGDPTLNAIAGATAGGAVLAFLFPIDTTKTQMQARGTSATATIKALITSEAPLRRIYRGLAPAIAEHAANRAMLFGVGAEIKKHVPREWPEPARDMASGAAAAFAKTTMLHPLDTIKCRWQVGLPFYQVSGLYSGLVPAQLRSSVGMGIWLSSRNQLERSLPPDEGRFWSLFKPFIVGALSSALTDLLTYPLDTLKKRMQAEVVVVHAVGVVVERQQRQRQQAVAVVRQHSRCLEQLVEEEASRCSARSDDCLRRAEYHDSTPGTACAS